MALRITTAGNVGIGTVVPATKLHVKNSISAIWGESTSGAGVFGVSAVSSLTGAGVYGKGTGSGSIGVIGEANINNAVGVYGVSQSPTGFGVYARNLFGGRAIYAEGNAGQNPSGNGLVKAMIYVGWAGGNVRCYNGVINSSTDDCGFTITEPLGHTAGVYRINFGFPVSDRFVSVICIYAANNDFYKHNCGANYRGFDSTSVEVFTFHSDNVYDTVGNDFTLIMY